jgi:hypothetical protein
MYKFKLLQHQIGNSIIYPVRADVEDDASKRHVATFNDGGVLHKGAETRFSNAVTLLLTHRRSLKKKKNKENKFQSLFH